MNNLNIFWDITFEGHRVFSFKSDKIDDKELFYVKLCGCGSLCPSSELTALIFLFKMWEKIEITPMYWWQKRKLIRHKN